MVVALGSLGVLIDAAAQDIEGCEIRSVVGRYLPGAECVVAATLYPHPIVLVSWRGGIVPFSALGEGHVTAVEITDSHELVIAQMDSSLSILPLPDCSCQPRKVDTVEVVTSCVALGLSDTSNVTDSTSLVKTGANKVICGTLKNQLFVVDLNGVEEMTCIRLPHDGPVLNMKLLGPTGGHTPSGNLLFVEQGGLFSYINLADDTVEVIEPKDPEANVLEGTVCALVSKNGPVFGLAELKHGTGSLHLYAPSQAQTRPLVSIPLLASLPESRIDAVTLIGEGGFVLCCYSSASVRSTVVLQTAMGDHNMTVQEFSFDDKVLSVSALQVPRECDAREWNICALVTTLHAVYSIKMSMSHLKTVLEALCLDLVESPEFVSVVKLCNALDFDFDHIVLGAGHQALDGCCVGSVKYASALNSALKVWAQRKKPVPLMDLRDVFGFISQWPVGIEAITSARKCILAFLGAHWHDMIPMSPDSLGSDATVNDALALWFVTALILLLTCDMEGENWRSWVDARVRRSVEDLNLFDLYCNRNPMTFDEFERIIATDFAAQDETESASRHFLRCQVGIDYEDLPTITAFEVRARLDDEWSDTMLAVVLVAIIDDAPLPLSLALLQNITRSVVLYVCTYALLARAQCHDVAAIELAVMSVRDVHELAKVGSGTAWELNDLYLRLQDVLEEAPTTGSWGSLCKTLLKTYPIWWELPWSTRFRLFLCTFCVS